MTEVRPLRAYAEIALGRQRSPEHDQGPHMVPYLRAANVKDGVLDLTDVKEMNFSPSEQVRFSLRPGDVLVSEGSGSLATVGASATWRGELDGTVCFQNTLLRVRPREQTDPRFLGWWCRHAFADGLFASVAIGANIFHISAERLRVVSVQYVQPHKQRAIADFLDTETARIDALIAKKRTLRARLGERECTAIEAEILGAARGEVRLRRLLSEPPQYGATESGEVGHSEWPRYIRITDLHQDGSLREGDAKRLDPIVARPFLLREGDVLFARSGATVGKAFRYRRSMGPACFAGYLIRMRFNADVALPEFVELWTQTWHYWDQITESAVQATIQNLNAERYLSLRLPHVPPSRQADIIRRLRRMREAHHEARAVLDQQIRLLHEHRQALITAAVTGELVVPGVAA